MKNIATVTKGFTTREINGCVVDIYHVVEWYIKGEEPMCKTIGVQKSVLGTGSNKTIVMNILAITHEGDRLTEEMVNANQATVWGVGVSGVYEAPEDILNEIGIEVVSIH